MGTWGKVAIVTGAGSGIGRATAQTFLRAGYAVVLAGRREQPLAETAKDSGAPAAHALIVPTDVTQPDSVRQLFVRTRKFFGRLDVLFNNAGVNLPDVPLDELPYERWRDIIDTNLTGAFLCTQEAFRLMKKQRPRGGRIINNGSLSAHVPRPNSAPYTASKHGVSGLTKSTALDGRTHDIVCSQINIGNAATPLTTRMKKGVRQADGSIIIEPTIDVQLVADAVLHMAWLPLEANVLTMTVMATHMPFVGRG